MKKLAVCDFDGTLSKGYISMGLLDYLRDRNVYCEESYLTQMRILQQHKQGKLSYDDWCEQWGELWAEGLKGREVAVVESLAREFFKGFKSMIYPVSYEMIDLLKRNDYQTLFLSVGAFEGIALAAEELKVDGFYCTKLGQEHGHYNGKIETNFHLPNGKEQQMKKIQEQSGITNVDSFGLGDSYSDVGFLSMTDHPLAVNPSRQLKEYAEQQGWTILDLNDNSVLGRLEGIIIHKK